MGSALFLCISGILYVIAQNQTKNNWNSMDTMETDAGFSETTSDITSDTDTMISKEEQKIKVYICGAVISPGVYEVSTQDRVDDLMDLCGGFCKDADLGDVNSAACLTDGEKIYIMTKKEAKNLTKKTQDQSGNESVERININTASQEELMTLPGIGTSKAKKIVTPVSGLGNRGYRDWETKRRERKG